MAFDEPPVTEDQLRDLLQRVGDVVTLLRHADADERREFYQDLGLRLAYQRLREQEKIRATLGVEFSPVGGDFPTYDTRGDLGSGRLTRRSSSVLPA